jgi:hypothetical protein
MRGVLDAAPSEGRILMFAMTSGAILFLAECVSLAFSAARAAVPPDRLSASFAAAFTALLILRPLMLYGLAALSGLAARVAGGTGSWRETRAAVCWAAVVAAPVGLAATLVEEVLLVLAAVTVDLGVVSVAAFAGMLSYCLAEAHGFRRAWLVFLIIAGLTFALWAVLLGSAG